MIVDHEQLKDIEDVLENIDEASLEDRQQLKERLDDLLDDSPPTNLEAYRDAIKKQQREEQYAGMSTIERAMSAAMNFLGYTPAREYSKTIDYAEGKCLELEERYTSAVKELDVQRQKAADIGRECVAAQGLFELCKHSYRDKQSQVDNLEAELEAMTGQARDRAVVALYEKREQLNNARQEQLLIRNETDSAMQKFDHRRKQYTALETEIDRRQRMVVGLGHQKNAFSIVIARAQLNREMFVGDRTPSLRELHDEAAVISQKLERLAAYEGAPDMNGFDPEFEIKLGQTYQDPSIEEWHEMRKL